MTSKHVIRESELPRPVASSILISRMKRSSVIIPYIIGYLYLDSWDFLFTLILYISLNFIILTKRKVKDLEHL